MFSKACEYGIRAMIYIAQRSAEGQRTGFAEIAEHIDSPTAFTAKILQLLSKEEFLKSSKGPKGGFELAIPAGDIKLSHIVSAIDGDKVFTGCALGLPKCNALKPCPLHYQFADVRDRLADMLHTTNLEFLVKNVDEGIGFLTRH